MTLFCKRRIKGTIRETKRELYAPCQNSLRRCSKWSVFIYIAFCNTRQQKKKEISTIYVRKAGRGTKCK